jgi:hypothetical protein
MSTFANLSDALMLSSGSLSAPLCDIVIVLVDASVDIVRKRGLISAIDTHIDEPVCILVEGAMLLEILSSKLAPGTIVLLVGLETPTGGGTCTNAIHPLRLSSRGFSSTAAMKVLTEDELQDKYNHRDADALIALSNQIKAQCLAQASCVRRSLADIQYSGQLSSVQVRVVSCEFLSINSIRFRRRGGQQKSTEAFAALADHDTRIVLTQCQKFIKELKVAQTTEEWIQITNLLSYLDKSGELLLKPTIRTLLLPAKPLRPWCQMVPDVADETQQSELIPFRRTVARLEAIFVDELNQSFEFNNNNNNVVLLSDTFATLLIANEVGGEPKYRATTLTLGGNQVVKANPYIMKVLCASIDAGLIITDSRTRQHVFQLVQGIVQGKTQLIWTLKENWIESLAMPRL